jgi:hypothetical protein
MAIKGEYGQALLKYCGPDLIPASLLTAGLEPATYPTSFQESRYHLRHVAKSSPTKGLRFLQRRHSTAFLLEISGTR